MSDADFDALLEEISRAVDETQSHSSSTIQQNKNTLHLHKNTQKEIPVPPQKRFYDREGRTFHTLLPRLDEDVETGRYVFSVKFTRLHSNPFQRLCFEPGQPIALYKSKKHKEPVMVVCVDTVRLNAIGRSANVHAWVVTGSDMNMHDV
eukprot:2354123-Rhodomonas_salina.2